MTTLSYEDFRLRRRIDALDGLRALSVLAVLTWHVRHSPMAFFHGGNGVWVFFVLSGFLITTLSLREEESRGELSLKNFFIRRAFRILPLYYLVLLGYVVLILVLHFDNRATEFKHMLPFYSTYLQEWGLFRYSPPRGLPFGISWTLGIEEKFYMAWPVLAFMILRKSRLRLPVTLTLAAVFVAVDVQHPWGYARFFQPYAHILLGCALALLLHRTRVYDQVRSWVRSSWTVAVAGVVVVALMFVPFEESETIWFSVAVALMLAGVVISTGGVVRFLSWRPLVWLGQASYVFYLTHQLGLQLADRIVPVRYGTAGDLATMVIGLAITLPMCAVLHRYFEQPLINLGRRISQRQTTTALAV